MLWTLFISFSAAEQLPTPQPFVFFQGWATLYDMDEDVQADPAGYGDPEDDTGFKIRRARVGVKAKDDRFLYRVSVGMSSGYDTVLQLGNDDIDIVDAYVVGDLDDPRKAVVFCSLLACVCEGRVQGLFDEETGKIKWSLTEKAEEEARLLVESAVSSSPNIVPGPWKSE